MLSGLVGSLIGGAFSAYGQAKANVAAKRAAGRQMSFQERMSNTSYQRGMADMRKAGLNPILAYRQGGAGTPGGASYIPGNIGAAFAQGAAGLSQAQSSLMTGEAAGEQATTARKEYRRKADKFDAELQNLDSQTFANHQAGYRAQTQMRVDMETAKRVKAETDIAKQNLQSAKAAASAARETERFYDTPLGQRLRAIGIIGTELNPFANSARSLAR